VGGSLNPTQADWGWRDQVQQAIPKLRLGLPLWLDKDFDTAFCTEQGDYEI